MKGQVTRLGSLYDLLESKHEYDEAKKCQNLKNLLAAMSDFGEGYRRGYAKNKSDTNLQALVPLKDGMETAMKDFGDFFAERIHWSLEILMRQVAFQGQWQSGRYKEAADELSQKRLASIYGGDIPPLPSHHVQAAQLILTKYEVKILDAVKCLKSDKRWASTLTDLKEFLDKVRHHIPQPAIIPETNVDFPERHRHERLRIQVNALYRLAQLLEDLGDQADAGMLPWPSRVKEWRAFIMGLPKTKIGEAVETLAGAKLFMQKVNAYLMKHELDDSQFAVIKEIVATIANLRTRVPGSDEHDKPDMTVLAIDEYFGAMVDIQQEFVKMAGSLTTLNQGGFEKV